MRIDSSATCSNPIRDARAAAGQQAQVVFSEVLKQVGRTGYASADAYQSPQAIETDIQRSLTNATATF